MHDSHFFVNTFDHSQLADKQDIFLVLAGLKPVAEAVSGHWVAAADGSGEATADDPTEVGAFLKSLGLAYRLLGSDQRYTQVQVALSQDLVDEYVHTVKAGPAVAGQIGRLFGYPETATRAFVDGSCLDPDLQQHIENQAGIPNHFVPFRFSRQHWQEELQTSVLWYKTLRAYGLA